jgi:Holliday junction resolvase
MKKQGESIILNQVRDYLRLSGWFVIRFQQGLGSHRGLSDLLAVKGGRHVFIEVKVPAGKQSEYQIKFESEILQHGGEYVLVRCLEDVLFLGVK